MEITYYLLEKDLKRLLPKKKTKNKTKTKTYTLLGKQKGQRRFSATYFGKFLNIFPLEG